MTAHKAGAGGASVVLSAAIELDATDILALHTTPVTVVPGAAGQVLIGLYAVGELHFNTIEYNAAGSLRFWTGADHNSTNFENDIPFGWVGQSANGIQPIELFAAVYGGGGFIFAELTDIEGQPMMIDAAGAFTAGDSTATFTVYYVSLSVG